MKLIDIFKKTFGVQTPRAQEPPKAKPDFQPRAGFENLHDFLTDKKQAPSPKPKV
jgi:hypothetical protein